MQYWRARSDAIVTGVDTVIADDPQLNVRAPEFMPCLQPLRVVLDTHLRTPAAARLLTDGGDSLLVHGSGAAVPDGLAGQPRMELQGGPRDLVGLLEQLGERGCNEVLVEAGPRVCGSFAAAGLWDEWLCYVAPKWLGSASRPLADFEITQLSQAPVGKVVEMTPLGDDIRIRMEPERP